MSNKELHESLERSKFTIRAYVTQKINLRYSPEIRFFFDSAYEDLNVIEMLKHEKA